MAYRKYYRRKIAKPTPRTIEVKYAARCKSCGGPIAVGEIATWYPAGYLGSLSAHLTHVKDVHGDSIRCFAWTMKPDSPTYFWKREDLEKLRASMMRNTVDKAVNDYAGDGLDMRYEDDCKERCGL